MEVVKVVVYLVRRWKYSLQLRCVPQEEEYRLYDRLVARSKWECEQLCWVVCMEQRCSHSYIPFESRLCRILRVRTLVLPLSIKLLFRKIRMVISCMIRVVCGLYPGCQYGRAVKSMLPH